MAEIRTRFVVGASITVGPASTGTAQLLQMPFDASHGVLDAVIVECRPSNGAVTVEVTDSLVPITGLQFAVPCGFSAPATFDTGGVYIRQNANIVARIVNTDATQAVTVNVVILGWIVRGG